MRIILTFMHVCMDKTMIAWVGSVPVTVTVTWQCVRTCRSGRAPLSACPHDHYAFLTLHPLQVVNAVPLSPEVMQRVAESFRCVLGEWVGFRV